MFYVTISISICMVNSDIIKENLNCKISVDNSDKTTGIVLNEDVNLEKSIDKMEKFRKNLDLDFGYTVDSDKPKHIRIVEEPENPREYILPLSDHFDIEIDDINSAYKFADSYYDYMNINKTSRSAIYDAVVILQMYSKMDKDRFFDIISQKRDLKIDKLNTYRKELIDNIESQTENDAESEDQNSFI